MPVNNRNLSLLGPISGGILVALLVTVMVDTLSFRWTLAVLGGLLVVLPLVVIKNVRLYGFALFLLFLMVEQNKGINLTKDIIDADQLVATLGIPPLSAVSIIIRPSDIVLFCLLLSWCVRILTKQDSFRLSRYSYLAFAYLGWAALSSVLKAPYPYLSGLEFIQEVKYFLLFVYISNAVDRRELIKGLIGVLLFCLFVEGVITIAGLKSQTARDLLSFLSSTSGVVELPFAYQMDESGQRAVGTFGNFAVTAIYLHFLLPLVFSQWLISLKNGKHWLYFCLLVLGIVALWFTYSRTGLIAAAFGLVWCFYLCYRRKFVNKQFVFAMVWMGLVSLLLISPQIEKYMTSRPTTLSDRYPIVEKALKLIVDSPFLGVGLNNSTAVKKQTFADTVPEENKQPIHNHYLVIACETGLVGFILFIGFFIAIGREALRQMNSPNVEIAAFAITVLSTYAAFSVHMVADTMFSHVPYAMLWFYAGLIVAFRRVERTASYPIPRIPSLVPSRAY